MTSFRSRKLMYIYHLCVPTITSTHVESQTNSKGGERPYGSSSQPVMDE